MAKVDKCKLESRPVHGRKLICLCLLLPRSVPECVIQHQFRVKRFIGEFAKRDEHVGANEVPHAAEASWQRALQLFADASACSIVAQSQSNCNGCRTILDSTSTGKVS